MQFCDSLDDLLKSVYKHTLWHKLISYLFEVSDLQDFSQTGAGVAECAVVVKLQVAWQACQSSFKRAMTTLRFGERYDLQVCKVRSKTN